jgi:15-cis-phytoene synthase
LLYLETPSIKNFTMLPLHNYNKVSFKISELVTRNYSTSFYTATLLLDKETRDDIYSIYGFVRFADEIVDTFHEYDKELLLQKFEEDYYMAMTHGLSLNPVLQSFQQTVKKHDIPDEHIQSFLLSMKQDLVKSEYKDKTDMDDYIFGSADVVGLMCLKVFCNGNYDFYKELERPAMKLGSAFQKVNFLRDLNSDMNSLNRFYFPDIQDKTLDEETKMSLILDIENDFEIAFSGIKRLPKRSKLAVLIAYFYYRNLLRKLKKTKADQILESRIRVSNPVKLLLVFKAMFIYKFKIV